MTNKVLGYEARGCIALESTWPGCAARVLVRNASEINGLQTGEFRGVYAAASLKHRPESSMTLKSFKFRGVYAAASLKLKRLSLAELDAADQFRGVYAAASLKPTRERTGRTDHR